MTASPPRLSRRAWLVGTAAGLAQSAALPARAADAGLLQLFGKPPGSIRRVFAAGPPAAALLAALAPDRLLGWPMPLSDAARAWLPEPARARPTLGRLSGRGSTVGVEALLALAPDLILDAGTVDATYRSTAERVATQTALPYALLDGRLADSPAQFRELGRLLGVAPRAEALARYAQDALAQAGTVRGAVPGRPSVYLARGADGLETALAGAINAEIIEAAGGRNVADTGRAGVARVSMEQVLAWNPDWVLTQDAGFFRGLRSDANWQALRAVREGRVLLLPDRPFGWIDAPPGVNRLLGLRCLAQSLKAGRPQAGEALDEARRFYALFWDSHPTQDELQALLDGRG
ncbi:ABC transporter substrate-binding protein [Roseateles sp.]|uniref:ABC transporter substrate-binding protein n=1 Tax=Roseateles sp. TaxID=1971397 RepID=UPI0039EA2234